MQNVAHVQIETSCKIQKEKCFKTFVVGGTGGVCTSCFFLNLVLLGSCLFVLYVLQNIMHVAKFFHFRSPGSYHLGNPASCILPHPPLFPPPHISSVLENWFVGCRKNLKKYIFSLNKILLPLHISLTCFFFLVCFFFI